MAKYLGIPLTVSNGNRTPLTAQPNKVENPTFEGTQTADAGNFILSSGWKLNNSGAGAAASSSEFTSEGAKIEWPAATPPSSTYLRAWNVGAVSNLTVFTVGKAYKMTYTISSSSNDSGLRLENGASIISLNTSVGTHELDFVADIDIFTIIRNNTLNSGATIVISSIYVKEIAATETPTYGSPEYVTNGEFADDSDWNITNGGWNASGPSSGSWACDGTQTSSTNLAQPNVFQGLTGKKVVISFEITAYTAGSVRFIAGDGSITGSSKSRIGTHETIGFVTNDATGLNIQADADFVGSVSNVSVKEVEYNYLQVADGGFTKSVKEGDVIFNTSTNTEGVVKQVVDSNVLLMSNDNFSTAGEFFNVFAANGDTRGNQVVRTDNYIMSEYDENVSNPQESSFWYAGGVDADKVTLTHLVPATNTFFVANVIEEYTQRLNAQSATASRLDIPLDAFRDHKNSEVLATTSITLS